MLVDSWEKQKCFEAILLARVDCRLKIESKRGLQHLMVELKARIEDHEPIRKKLTELGAEHIGVFRQTDTYFRVPEGRLKLREIEGSRTAELIYYEREDVSGPKGDRAFILRAQDGDELRCILERILAPLVKVSKMREVFRYQGTQIHLDTVCGLGKFVEFERPVGDNETMTEAQQRLDRLRETLKIKESSLEALSYSDLIKAKK